MKLNCPFYQLFFRVKFRINPSITPTYITSKSLLIKMRLRHKYFPVNFTNFFRTPFSQNTPQKVQTANPLHKKMKFSIKDFFRKCDYIHRKLRTWSHVLKKSLMENFIFCAVTRSSLALPNILKLNTLRLFKKHMFKWCQKSSCSRKLCRTPQKKVRENKSVKNTFLRIFRV